jgi:hypothetical protein
VYEIDLLESLKILEGFEKYSSGYVINFLLHQFIFEKICIRLLIFHSDYGNKKNSKVYEKMGSGILKFSGKTNEINEAISCILAPSEKILFKSEPLMDRAFTRTFKIGKKLGHLIKYLLNIIKKFVEQTFDHKL